MPPRPKAGQASAATRTFPFARLPNQKYDTNDTEHYSDSHVRTLPEAATRFITDGMTPAKCVAACSAQGFSLAGVEYAGVRPSFLEAFFLVDVAINRNAGVVTPSAVRVPLRLLGAVCRARVMRSLCVVDRIGYDSFVW